MTHRTSLVSNSEQSAKHGGETLEVRRSRGVLLIHVLSTFKSRTIFECKTNDCIFVLKDWLSHTPHQACWYRPLLRLDAPSCCC